MQSQAFSLLQQHLGSEREQQVLDYLKRNNCSLYISKPRKTKLGDFSVRQGKKRISVNNDLNKYRFILTLIHELAHLKTFNEKNWTVKPHGEYWKQSYRDLLLYFRIEELFSGSSEMLEVYNKEFHSPRACSGTELRKEELLSIHDHQDGPRLIELSDNQEFEFRGARYRKLHNRRSRAMCLKLENNRKYTIPLAAIVQI